MQKHAEAMSQSNLPHNLHRQLIVVGGNICFFKNRRTFKLAWSHLVMTSLQRNAQFIKFVLYFGHKGLGPSGNTTEVMILQLLPLGGMASDQGSASHHQIRAEILKKPVYKEIFLFD